MHDDGPAAAVIHRVFAACAEQRPDAVAVDFESRSLTYAELSEQAVWLATVLRGMGVGPDVPVGVYLARGLDLVIATLGVLAADGAYVPLDPEQPPAWTARQLEVAPVRLVITTGADRDRLPDGARTLVLDELSSSGSVDARLPPAPIRACPDNLAYIMFTSGSTGQPKAVAIPHRGVVNLVTDQRYAQFGPGHAQLFQSAHTFDAATLAIWGTLLNGGRLAIAPPGPFSVGELAHLIRVHRVTSLFLTTTMFQLMLEEHPAALRPLEQLLTGGEAVYPASLELARRLLPTTRVVVMYGPTEVTVTATAYTPSATGPHPAGPMIGTDIGNVTTYILDADLNPVATGDTGELCVAGPGLAWGYLGAPDTTAERFLPDPHSAVPGRRLYRTGDRVRRVGDESIEFIGRLDSQVKLRGRRIEPTEVEQALLAHPDVTTAYVAKERNTQRGSYLAAYVTGRPDTSPTQHELRRHMEEAVPDHLRPDVYIVRAETPLTASGKLDRRRLLDAATAVAAAGPTNDRRYVVVLNDEAQHAIWPEERAIPPGWRGAEAAGSLDECRAFVRRVWTDIRPARLHHP
jgi:amino acid adenylation domain-containing protein